MSKYFLIPRNSEDRTNLLMSGSPIGIKVISEIDDLIYTVSDRLTGMIGVKSILLITNPTLIEIPPLTQERRDMIVSFTSKQVQEMSNEQFSSILIAASALSYAKQCQRDAESLFNTL